MALFSMQQGLSLVPALAQVDAVRSSFGFWGFLVTWSCEIP